MVHIIAQCKACNKQLRRSPSSIEPSGNTYCSSSCFAKYSNKHRDTRLSIVRRQKISQKPICANTRCVRRIGIDNKTYCSPECRFESVNRLSKESVLREIKEFFAKRGRIPIKYEIPTLSSRGRRVFGTWNNAIKAAGFVPNQVVFSKKFTANDGHKCDSLSEKIVDDWLFARSIKHETQVKYPWNNHMTADFKIGDFWVELFGLSGQLKKYDILMQEKLKLIKKHNLKLISLYLTDIFPVNKLEEKLGVLQK